MPVVLIGVLCLGLASCRSVKSGRRVSHALVSGGELAPFGRVYRSGTPRPMPENPCPEAMTRKAIAESLDIHGLLYTGRTVSDCSVAMLTPPSPVAGYVGGEIAIALSPPRIDFTVIPAHPRWLRVYNNQYRSGWWGCYCPPVYDLAAQKYYSAVADHGARDAHLYLVEYDPNTRQALCPVEYNWSVGRAADRFGAGMVQGRLGFYRLPDLPRPHLWFCTGVSMLPGPAATDYSDGYDGGHIVSWDAQSSQIVDYGVPLPGAFWSFFSLDEPRGRLYAVGNNNEFLAWNIVRQRTEWAGFLPPGMVWNKRAIMVDDRTGRVFTSNEDPNDLKKHLICYDPVTKQFALLDSHMPANPAGAVGRLLGHTGTRAPDGLFWAVTEAGTLFSFDPDNEKIVARGQAWPDSIGTQSMVTALTCSPAGRYLYYPVNSFQAGSPVIQYDIKTGTRKVLMFLYPYYHEKYGYLTSGSNSLIMNPDGSELFMVWNGAFVTPTPDIGADARGHCSIMHIKIPLSERLE